MNSHWMNRFAERSARPRVLAGLMLAADATRGRRAGRAPPAAQGAVSELSKSQRDAQTLLQRMAGYLAGLKSFDVSILAGYDVVQSSGQKIEFSERRKLTVDRPARLRME